MINILELSNKVKEEGYNEEQAEAKLCQDIILLLLSKSRFKNNITIKGGVVMRSLSKDARRATLDLDLDLIHFPLNNKGIKEIITALNNIDGIKIRIVKPIEKLKHQDYDGKRAYVEIDDSFGNSLTSKIDIGVHKYIEIEQAEYCFDIAASDEGVSLLINTKEQMFVEKLKSLLKFGPLSTRFKDIYDMYYLSKTINTVKLNKCVETFIFNDPKLKVKNANDISKSLEQTFKNQAYIINLNNSNKNWVGISNEKAFNTIINTIKKIEN